MMCSSAKHVFSTGVVIVVFFHTALETTAHSFIVSVHLICVTLCWMKLCMRNIKLMRSALMINMSYSTASIAWKAIKSRRFIKIWLLISVILRLMTVRKYIIKFPASWSLQVKSRHTLAQLQSMIIRVGSLKMRVVFLFCHSILEKLKLNHFFDLWLNDNISLFAKLKLLLIKFL